MALKRLTINRNAVLELNQVAFRRDGRIEAQLPLDATDFATINAEAGMLLEVKPNDAVGLPGATPGTLVGLHYSTEKLYNQYDEGLNAWSLPIGTFYPRIGYLAVGDKFTTNCIAYDTTDILTDDALKTLVAGAGTTPLYGQPCANGAIQLTADKPADGVALQVVKEFTIPNGDYAVQFIVINA